MNPTNGTRLSRLTDEQRRSLLAEIRNARQRGYDGIVLLFSGEEVVVIPQNYGEKRAVKPSP